MKTKDQLLKELQDLATKAERIKETIELMLTDLESIEKKYVEISEEIKKQ